MHPRLYGQCRSINNATLAEVKEACVSGGSAGGEEGGEGHRGDKEDEVIGKRGKLSRDKKKQMCLFKCSFSSSLRESKGNLCDL